MINLIKGIKSPKKISFLYKILRKY
ncbi:hypothetical protein BAPKO_0237 [Borreliella afzelii PKo]|nr:hypothetical protein BAPKO_0237 [Borreliella afzelii PKo]